MLGSFFKKKSTDEKADEKKAKSGKAAKKFSWKKIISFNFSEINQGFFDEIEEALILGDVGGSEVVKIMQLFREKIAEEKIKSIDAAQHQLKQIFKSRLVERPLVWDESKLPILVMMGINGVGKTTTIAKLSQFYSAQFPEQVWGAADTFRAAATQQLEAWSKELAAHLINKGEGADPASVAFDSIHSALARKNKTGENKVLAIIDTAGRLHNKEALMSELKKIVRVSDKFENQVDRKNILVLDATLGINGFEQAKVFHEKIGLDGIILTKMDTLAKGGSVFSISNHFNLPIWFTTFGESLENISPFNIEEYIESII